MFALNVWRLIKSVVDKSQLSRGARTPTSGEFLIKLSWEICEISIKCTTLPVIGMKTKNIRSATPMRALMKSANYCVLSRPRSIVIAIKRNIFIYHRFINHGHVYNTSKLNGGGHAIRSLPFLGRCNNRQIV